MRLKRSRQKLPGSWLGVPALKNDKDTIQRNETPCTFVRGAVTADSGDCRSTYEEKCAHNEHTKPHRDAEAKCTRTNGLGSHDGKLRVELLAGLSRQTGRVWNIAKAGKIQRNE